MKFYVFLILFISFSCKAKIESVEQITRIAFRESMSRSRDFDSGYVSICPRWKMLENLYSENITNLTYVDNSLKIPKVIHWIWLGSPLPKRYIELQKTFKELHPSWQVKIWTDQDIEPFKLKNKIAFDAATNFGEKSDIFRYEILERFGGVYCDTDFKCLQSLDLLHYVCEFYTGIAYDREAILYNGLIGASPHHPIIKKCVDCLINTPELKDPDFIMERTGPYYFTEQFFKVVFGGLHKGIVAFPVTFFYPFPNYLRNHLVPENFDTINNLKKPESFTVHHWDSSWCEWVGIPKD